MRWMRACCYPVRTGGTRDEKISADPCFLDSAFADGARRLRVTRRETRASRPVDAARGAALVSNLGGDEGDL